MNPMMGGAPYRPPVPGYPPQTAYGMPPATGYPPQTGGYVTQQTVTTMTSTQGGGGMPPPPSTGFNNSWFAQFYNQINPQEMYEIQSWFASIDLDRSGSITANEIAAITFNGVPLGLEVASKLVQVFDRDRSGNVSFHEYASMHKFLSTLQAAFFAADQDRSGRIDAREIYNALARCGFTASFPSIQALMYKYDKTGYGLMFQDFLKVCSTIAQTRSLFQWKDPQRTGQISVTQDQLIELVAQMS